MEENGKGADSFAREKEFECSDDSTTSLSTNFSSDDDDDRSEEILKRYTRFSVNGGQLVDTILEEYSSRKGLAENTAPLAKHKNHKSFPKETREHPQGDTNYKLIPTRRGGCSLIFRRYCFRISRKMKTKSYWRCQTKACKVTVVIENDMFKSMAGTHQHEPDEERKMAKLQKKKDKLERIKKAREERIEKMKLKEVEKNKINAPENITMEPIITTNIIQEIRSMHANEFDLDEFNNFSERFTKFFETYLEINSDMNSSSVNNLLNHWNSWKIKIENLANDKRTRKKDKRLKLMEMALNKCIIERDNLQKAKSELENGINTLNVDGCRTLLDKISHIQNKANCNNHSQIVPTPPPSVQRRTIDIANGDIINYKALYELVVKERDMLKLKQLENNQYSFQESSNQTHIKTSTQLEPLNSQNVTPQRNIISSTNTSPNSVQLHQTQHQMLRMVENSGEPQILYEDTQNRQSIWNNTLI